MGNTIQKLRLNVARLTEDGDLRPTAIPGLSLFRREELGEPFTGMFEPSLCMVIQGAKRVILGDDWSPRKLIRSDNACKH